MANIEIHPFGVEYVIVKFRCDKCGSDVISEELYPPAPDYSAETAKDSWDEEAGYAQCPHCSKEFDITIGASYSGGYIEINDIEDEDLIEIITKQQKLDDFYEDQIETILLSDNPLDTFHREISLVKGLNELSLSEESLERTLKRQLFAASITCMEVYLSDTIINAVLKREELFKKFVSTYQGIKAQKFELSKIFEVQSQLRDVVKKELLDIIYHHLPKVKGMYEDTFGIEFPSIAEVARLITLRHHIVHRNGKTKDREQVTITKSLVSDVIEKVTNFVNEVDSKIPVDNTLSVTF